MQSRSMQCRLIRSRPLSQVCLRRFLLWLFGVTWFAAYQSISIGADPQPNELSSSRRTEQPVSQSFQSEPLIITDLSVGQDPSNRLPLDAREVACLAACRWHPAVGLRQRVHTIRQLFCNDSHGSRQASTAIVNFLQLQAAHQEDIGAASAMRAYYSRIGITEQQQWIHAGGKAVELQQQKQQSLLEHGFATALDLSSLQRKNLDLQDQWLQTSSQLRQLQKLLTGLTGQDFECAQHMVEPLVVQSSILDCEKLIAQAFRNRSDLLAWQQLCCHIDEHNAPMVATILSSISGNFGLPMPTASLLKRLTCQGLDPSVLADSLKRELSVLIQTHQAYIEQSVQEKCEQLQLAYQRHEIELHRIDNWVARIEKIDRLESHGQTRPDQKMIAEAGLLESHSTEVTRRLDAKLAEIALAEAVGGLAIRSCQGLAWLPTGY